MIHVKCKFSRDKTTVLKDVPLDTSVFQLTEKLTEVDNDIYNSDSVHFIFRGRIITDTNCGNKSLQENGLQNNSTLSTIIDSAKNVERNSRNTSNETFMPTNLFTMVNQMFQNLPTSSLHPPPSTDEASVANNENSSSRTRVYPVSETEYNENQTSSIIPPSSSLSTIPVTTSNSTGLNASNLQLSVSLPEMNVQDLMALDLPSLLETLGSSSNYTTGLSNNTANPTDTSITPSVASPTESQADTSISPVNSVQEADNTTEVASDTVPEVNDTERDNTTDIATVISDITDNSVDDTSETGTDSTNTPPAPPATSMLSTLQNVLTLTRSSNLQNLTAMGYTDTDLNNLALDSTNNNLEAAIQWIEALR